MNWKYHKPEFECESLINPLHSGWYGHVYFAYDLVINTKPKTIVELGTHKGHSFFSFCQAIKDAKIKTKLVAVDTWQGDKHAGFYGDEVYKEVQDVVKKYYNTVDINLRRKSFDEALKGFKDNSINILHIDGLHTYEAVKHDFVSWLPKVKADGIIILHDIVVKEDGFGVYKFWDEIKKDFYSMEFHHSNGLGILVKKKNKLVDFFDNQNLWRHCYENIINDKLARMELIQKDKDIERKNQKVLDLNQILQQKNQEVDFMKSSKFWKLRKSCLGMQFFVFHPLRFFEKYFR